MGPQRSEGPGGTRNLAREEDRRSGKFVGTDGCCALARGEAVPAPRFTTKTRPLCLQSCIPKDAWPRHHHRATASRHGPKRSQDPLPISKDERPTASVQAESVKAWASSGKVDGLSVNRHRCWSPARPRRSGCHSRVITHSRRLQRAATPPGVSQHRWHFDCAQQAQHRAGSRRATAVLALLPAAGCAAPCRDSGDKPGGKGVSSLAGTWLVPHGSVPATTDLTSLFEHRPCAARHTTLPMESLLTSPKP
jgi:hypothetical protein